MTSSISEEGVVSPAGPQRRRLFGAFTALFLCGVAIGWLIGLSATPVVQVVVSGVLTLAAGFVSAVLGVSAPNPAEHVAERVPSLRTGPVSPLPVALLAMGIAIGAPLGIYARTNDWFAADIPKALARWRALGLSDQEVAAILVPNVVGGKKEPADSSASGESPPGNSGLVSRGVLFAELAPECARLQSVDGAELVKELSSSSSLPVRQFTRNVAADSSHWPVLPHVVRLICASDPR